MKSYSISGLSYALFPNTTLDQSTYTTVDSTITAGGTTGDIIISNNKFYLFEGDMPAAEVLSAFDTSTAFLAAYSANQILKIENFDLRYTYDKTLKRRKMEKWPVDAESFISALDGTAKWAMIHLEPQSLTIAEDLMLFTDAVGGWDDADQSILVSSTTVVAGEPVTVKSINITVQDALLVDL